MPKINAILIVLALLLAPDLAFAQDRTESSTPSSLFLFGALNPEGVMVQAKYGYKAETYTDAYKDIATRHLYGGLTYKLNPSATELSLVGEVMPAPFFVFKAEAGLTRYFGAFTALLSFDSKNDRWDRGGIDAREGDEETAWGTRLLAQPNLRAQFGHVIVSNQTDFARFHFGGSGPYYYETTYDTLLSNNDLLLVDRAHLLYKTDPNFMDGFFILGPSYELIRTRDAGLTRQRMGLLLAWNSDQPLEGYGKPTALLNLGVNTQDHNRAGQPFAVFGLGLSF